jgi:hypothetical protein
MGADMIMYTASYPSEGFEPDWDKGEEVIKELSKDQGFLDEYCYDSEEEGYELFMSKFTEFQDAYNGKRRDEARENVGAITIMMSGGMSWGESPSDLGDIMGDLERYDILDACGFNDRTDWKKLFDLVLDKGGSKLLPLLMGIDPKLDTIVANKLKGE